MLLAATDLGGHITHRFPQGGRQDAQAVVPTKTQGPESAGEAERTHLSPVSCPTHFPYQGLHLNPAGASVEA